MAMVDSFARTSGSYGSEVPPMRDSRKMMLTELEEAITETTKRVREAGPEADVAALETLDLLAEVYDICKNGGKE